MSEAAVIETHRLRKSYGKVEAVRDVSLCIQPNRITALLGLNGAGKSTTIKMLLGMTQPTGGEGRVLGRRIDHPVESVALRQKVAYVGEGKRLYDYMTVDQTIRFTRSFYPDWRPEVERGLLRMYALPLNRKVKSLSKGMRTKLALLLAFARRPELLILDEPSDGLDPIGIEQMLEGLIAQCAEGASVFFSSHQIAEVERVADQVCIFHQGRLVADAAMDDMRQRYRRIEAVFPRIVEESALRTTGVEKIWISGRQAGALVSGNEEGVCARFQQAQAESIEILPIGLRDIFLETVKER